MVTRAIYYLSNLSFITNNYKYISLINYYLVYYTNNIYCFVFSNYKHYSY